MIYLDHNATTFIRPGVMETITSVWTQHVGNPSSVHGAGRAARQALDRARRQVARLVGVHESQVIFTSGGTEANNLALFGLTARFDYQGHVLTSAVEHASLLIPAKEIQKRGMGVTFADVDGEGVVDPMQVLGALRDDTRIVSIMHANNETGVIQPIENIADGCRAAGVPFHVDAAQTLGKVPIDFTRLGVDMMTLSSHKIGGPQGVGALIIDKRMALQPRMIGGGQERGRRSGTENLPAIVGFGAAAVRVQSALEAEPGRLCALRDQLENSLKQTLPSVVIFGAAEKRLPNTSAIGFDRLDGATLVMNLDLEGFAVSSGSACGSGKTEPSHVLQAMGIPASLARGFIRVSLGWTTTSEEVERFVAALKRIVDRLYKMTPDF
jgi:cysteine desulfurase